MKKIDPRLRRAAVETLESRTLLTVTATGSFNISDPTTYSTRPQTINITFSADVSSQVSAPSLRLESITGNEPAPIATSESWNASTKTATFVLASSATQAIIPDGNYRATLSHYSISGLASDVVVDFYVLAADATRDRSVNIADQGILATNYGQSNTDFSHGDFNYDTSVNIADLGVVATNYGVTLPAPPTSPNEITAGNQTTSSIETNWQDSQPNGLGYHLQWCDDGESFDHTIELTRDDPRLTIQNGNVSFTDTGLPDATRRWYRVRAFGNGLDTAYTPKVSSYTLTAAPTDASATLAPGGTYMITWTNHSAHPTGVKVYVAIYDNGYGVNDDYDFLDMFAQAGATATCTYTPDSPGRYTFSLVTQSAAGDSAFTPWFEYVRPPTSVTATPISSSEIDLGWTAPEQPVDGFEVLRSTTGASGLFSALPITLGSNTTTLSDTGLVPNERYDYEVEALYNGSMSQPTMAFATTQLPTAPANVQVVADPQNNITISWQQSAEDIDGYKVYKIPYSGGAPILCSESDQTDKTIDFIPKSTVDIVAVKFTDTFSSADTNPSLYFVKAVKTVNSSQIESARSNTQVCVQLGDFEGSDSTPNTVYAQLDDSYYTFATSSGPNTLISAMIEPPDTSELSQPEPYRFSETRAGGDISATFQDDGMYVVRELWLTPSGLSETNVLINSGTVGLDGDFDLGGSFGDGRWKAIPPPDEDLILVDGSSGTGDPYFALSDVRAGLNHAGRSSEDVLSVLNAEQKIEDCGDEHFNDDFSIASFGHGEPGIASMGGGADATKDDRYFLTQINNTEMFDFALNAESAGATRIRFYDCLTGAGSEGAAFITLIGQMGIKCEAFDCTIKVAADTGAMMTPEGMANLVSYP